MNCQNCNKEVPEDSKFCSYCGTEIKRSATQGIGSDIGKKNGNGILEKVINIVVIIIGFVLGRYLGLSIFIFLGAYLLGIWFPRWYAGHEKVNVVLVKCIVWSNLVAWFLPPLGILTGFATLGFSNYFPSESKKYKILAVIAIVAALINASVGIYQASQ